MELRMDRDRLLRRAGSLLLILGSIVLLVVWFDIRKAFVTVRSARLDMFGLAVVLFYLSFVFRGERWHQMLQNATIDADRRDSWETLFLSFYANNIVPGQLGDLYRGHLLGARGQFASSRVIGTVVADRVLDLMVIVSGFLLLGLFLYAESVYAVINTLVTGQQVLLVLFVGGIVVVGFYLVSRVDRVNRSLSKAVEGFKTSVSRKNAGTVLVLTVLLWAAVVFRVWLVVQAVGIDQGVLFAGFLGFTMLFLSMVPLTPAGLGVVEVVTTAGFVFVGMNAELMLAAILLDRTITYGSLIVTGATVAALTDRQVL